MTKQNNNIGTFEDQFNLYTMRHLSLFSFLLLFISCGPSALQNIDIETQVIGKSGILSSVSIGDSWDEVKKIAGDYWEVEDSPEDNIYQFRKDINLSNEHMFISFKLVEGKVGGMGLYILSENIPSVSFELYKSLIWELYSTKFGIDFSDAQKSIHVFNNQRFKYSVDLTEDEGKPTSLFVDCYPA
ncbi:MAG: hypothetical protein AB8B72_00260 [Crocinitomicaceae bacterium]